MDWNSAQWANKVLRQILHININDYKAGSEMNWAWNINGTKMNKNTLQIQDNGGKNALAQAKSITAVTIKNKCEN